MIDAEKVVNGIDYENKANAFETLLGLHALTGCNATSALHGFGKKKALRAMLNHDSVKTFRLLGQERELC